MTDLYKWALEYLGWQRAWCEGTSQLYYFVSPDNEGHKEPPPGSIAVYGNSWFDGRVPEVPPWDGNLAFAVMAKIQDEDIDTRDSFAEEVAYSIPKEGFDFRWPPLYQVTPEAIIAAAKKAKEQG